MRQLFLNKLHEKAGAKFTELNNYLIPVDYGNVKNELHAIDNRIALLDRSYLGKIAMKGKDALDMLDRITTNDLHFLSMGTVCDTIFATPKGRLIDFCRIINCGDELVLIGSFFHVNHLNDWINRFIILEDAEVRDVSDQYVWLTIMGPMCKPFLNHFTESKITGNEEAIWLKINDIVFPALKNNNFNVESYNFCLDRENAERIVSVISATINEMGGSWIGDTAFQIIRVESGMPDWGTEITQDYNPHEARLLNAVSFTKGCYTGQEVIARLDTYDKVQKYLMIIDLDQQLEPQKSYEVYIEDELIGNLTSHVFNPVSIKSIGLGYINKMYTMENNIYVEISTENGRIPGKLRKPPQAYS